jgi:hypothetical protein
MFDNALSALRVRAEAETMHFTSLVKRPTWAPPMVLAGELLDLLCEMEMLEDKPVARLWGIFASPKKRDSFSRQTFSQHPLEGMRCRGFELHAGEDHGGQRLVRALLNSDGQSWSVGTPKYNWTPVVEWHERRLQGLLTKGAQAPEPPLWRMATVEQLIAQGLDSEMAAEIAASYDRFNNEAHAQWEAGEARKRDPAVIEKNQQEVQRCESKLACSRKRQDGWPRIFDLARKRLGEFLNDPQEQRRAGSRVTGNCCCCGKGLTDPVSLERGIGPECFKWAF